MKIFICSGVQSSFVVSLSGTGGCQSLCATASWTKYCAMVEKMKLKSTTYRLLRFFCETTAEYAGDAAVLKVGVADILEFE